MEMDKCYMYSFKQLFDIVNEISKHSRQTVRLDQLEENFETLSNDIKLLKQEDQDIRNKMIGMNREIVLDITQQHNEAAQNNSKIHKLIKAL